MPYSPLQGTEKEVLMTEPRPSKVFQRKGLMETIGVFLSKGSAYGGAVQTNGRILYSYLIIIGTWNGDVVETPRLGAGMSRTTRQHRYLLREMATARSIQLKEV